MTSDHFKTINVDGLELTTLKGGFVCYLYDRTSRRQLGTTEPVAPEPVVEQEPVVEDEPVEDQDEDRTDRKPQFLLCKKCGTVINVFLNDRNARCCNQLMIPLVESAMTEAENN